MELVKSNIKVFIKSLYKNYKKDEIDVMSAAITFFLIFSTFPTIVFASTVLGYLDISNSQVFAMFLGVLPRDVIDLVVVYLDYLGDTANTNILMVSLFFTLYFPIRTMNKLMDGINRAFQIESKRKMINRIALMVVLGIFLFISVAAILFLLVVGRNILTILANYLPISMEFIQSWSTIRFFVMALIAFVFLTIVYWLVPEIKLFIYEAMPGAVFASIGWILFSACFSFYVENMGNYSLLYGSIGAIIILLIWLRMMVVILLMGAEINSIIKEIKTEKNHVEN